MLKKEASATYETDSSFFSMTAVYKRLKRKAGLVAAILTNHSFSNN
ncbi:hypothetical protein [Pedobacter aquatilis]|nr:hypothetical protein [Pedobacter aquatilis]